MSSSVTLDDAIVEYLASRKARGIKPGTIKNERTAVTQFMAATGNLLVRNVTGRHVDMWFSRYSHHAVSTVNRDIGYLQGFFKWCRARKYVPRDFDPFEGVKLRKAPPTDFIFIPKDRFGEFLDTAVNGRNRAVLAIGLYTFQRASEIKHLRWEDVRDSDPDPKKWKIAIYRGKTETRDWLPLCLELQRELQRWRLHYGTMMGEPPRPEWRIVPAFERGEWRQGPAGRLVRKSPLRLNPTAKINNMQYIVQHSLEAIGYRQTKQEGAHTLRRSGGLALYEELAWNRGHDAALRVVQSMYGHAALSTTEKYLRLKLETKRRNDLLAGQAMFPVRETEVISIGQAQGNHQ